jgi:site-specific recombinase XerD
LAFCLPPFCPNPNLFFGLVLGGQVKEGVANPVITQRHYIDQGHRLPRDIRQNEIEMLFTAIGDHLRDRTILTLMLHTGMRVGEVANLRLADVYLSETRPPHLRVFGKGQRERIAYLSATASLLLNEYLSGRPTKTQEKVFLNQRGKPMNSLWYRLRFILFSLYQIDLIRTDVRI